MTVTAYLVVARRPAALWLAARVAVPVAGLLMVRAVGATPPSLPVDVHLSFASPPTLGRANRVDVTVRTTAALGDVGLEVHGEGVVRVIDAVAQPGDVLRAGEEFRQRLAVDITSRGRGQLDARVAASTAEGAPIASTATVYVVVDEAGVGVGTDGFSRLERERLELLHRRSMIPEDEYQRRRERLPGGGAQEVPQ